MEGEFVGGDCEGGVVCLLVGYWVGVDRLGWVRRPHIHNIYTIIIVLQPTYK